MSGLPGYDAWKCYDAAGERAAALDALIDRDEDLARFQRRIERMADRRDAIASALAAEPAGSARHERLSRMHERFVRLARYAAQDLQSAIEDAAEDYDGPDTLEEARGER